MATNKKDTKKVKDLDPKGRSAEVKGGKSLLSKSQTRFVKKVIKKGTDAAHDIRG